MLHTGKETYFSIQESYNGDFVYIFVTYLLRLYTCLTCMVF